MEAAADDVEAGLGAQPRGHSYGPGAVRGLAQGLKARVTPVGHGGHGQGAFPTTMAANGPRNAIGFPALSVAVEMGVIQLLLPTQTVLPSGLTATASG